MSDSFEKLVIQRLDDLKQDVIRSSDQNREGLKKLFDLHETHVQDDITRFEKIDGQFTDAAVLAAEAKGTAKATAKFWGIIVALPGSATGMIWTVWKFLQHIHYVK